MSIQDHIDRAVKDLNFSYKRWNEINTKGCKDPFYHDGMNMNLVRNHIIYHKRLIKGLLLDKYLDYPIEYFYELPQEVSNEYMAVPRKLLNEGGKGGYD